MCSMTSPLVYLSPAKINWFLHVTGRRDDGYHLLETVFQRIDWFDEVHIAPRDDGLITVLGDLSGVTEKHNLAYQAAVALKKESGLSGFGAVVRLVKNIPTGAGLGGGSSNAATVLLALNKLWQLNFSNQYLQEIGLTLGADVPFFVSELNAAFASGVGEVLQAIDLPVCDLLLVKPNVSVSTESAFSYPDLIRDHSLINLGMFELAQKIQSNPDGFLTNDLEKSTFAINGEVALVCRALCAVAPKSLVRMSGSGSTIFVAPQNELERSHLRHWQKYQAPEYWQSRWVQAMGSCITL